MQPIKPIRKKVLLLARSLDQQSAGIHVYAKNLIAHLDNFGSHDKFEYWIARVDNKVMLPLTNVKQAFFKNKYRIPAFGPIRLFFLIPRFANKNKFDVVVELSHFGPFNLNKKTKRVTVLHDLTPVLFSHFHTFFSSFLQKLFLPRILKRADLIIANSINTKEDIYKVYPSIKTKTEAIYLGVSKKFNSENSKTKENLSHYGVSNNYILYLGTIEPRKNLTTLLRAYEIFRDTTDLKIDLVIAGKSGWKNEEFNEALKKSKFIEDIKITGYVDSKDIFPFYANCDVFVYPSEYEGFGIPVIEALRSGAQVICANNSSLLEFGEELVFYFDTHKPDSLAQMLKQVLIKKERKTFSQTKLKEKYSWESYVTKFEQQLDQLK